MHCPDRISQDFVNWLYTLVIFLLVQYSFLAFFPILASPLYFVMRRKEQKEKAEQQAKEEREKKAKQ